MINCSNNSVNNNFQKYPAQEADSKKHDKFLPVVNLVDIPTWITNPYANLSHWTMAGVVRVLNDLAGYANLHLTVYPTQATIAKNIGMSREHVNRLLAYCVSVGLITKQWRAYTSCIYKLHPVFNDVNFRRSIKDLMPNLRWLPLLLLVSITLGIHPQFKPANPGFITLSINSYPLYIKKLLAIAIKKYNNLYQVDHRVITKDNKTHISLYKKDMKQKIMESVAMTQPLFSDGVMAAAEFLKLSMAGKCNISAFNDQVIAISLQRIKGYGKEIHKPFNMAMKLCAEISHEMGIAVERSRAYQIATQMGINLGIDDNILPGCDKPLKPKSHQREGYKPYSSQNKQFGSKSASFSSSNTNTHPVTQSINGKWNLSKLQELNPDIDLSQASFIGIDTLMVTTPSYDKTYRETTQEERDIWNNARASILTSESGKLAQSLGIMMPEAPMWFSGNCNVPESTNYIITPEGKLILPGQTNLTLKSQAIPQPNPTILRSLTATEEEMIQWFRDYYKFLKQSQTTIPAWYISLTNEINQRTDNLERKLTLFRHTLESDGWTRLGDGTFKRVVLE